MGRVGTVRGVLSFCPDSNHPEADLKCESKKGPKLEQQERFRYQVIYYGWTLPLHRKSRTSVFAVLSTHLSWPDLDRSR